MHEILAHLPAEAYVLDLGCADGSFALKGTAAKTIRVDLGLPRSSGSGVFAQADAALLPFPDRCFSAIVSNHSLEHFEQLDEVLGEISRVVRRDGALFVSVPDASTFTDKLYRWLTHGGGHVNPFTSADELAKRIETATGLKHVATKTLYSSLSFLNERNATGPRPRRWRLVGGGTEWSLRLYSWTSRRLDQWFRTRTSVYGWAFYLGELHEAPDTRTWINVCIRCGGGLPPEAAGALTRKKLCFSVYDCPNCGATNAYCRG